MINLSRGMTGAKRCEHRPVLLIFLILMLFSLDLFSAPFRIINRQYGNIPTQNHGDIDTLFNQIEVEVNKALPEVDGKAYLDSTSNASVISVKGLGVDYADDIEIFVVGYGIGVGVDVGERSLSDILNGDIDVNQLKGIGVQTGYMAGINMSQFKDLKLGFIDTKRIVLFMNYGSMTIPKLESSLDGQLKTFGLHAQYLLVSGYKLPFYIFRWGGIFITTGVDYAKMKFTFTKNFTIRKEKDLDIPALGNPQVTAAFDGQAMAGADSKVYTIPLEISTHAQFTYLLTLFGGLGLDFSFGKSTAKADTSGTISASDTLGVVGTVSGQPDLDLGFEGKPDTVSMRWFLGTQINLSLLKIYAQLNKGIGHDTWGINLGFRVAY